MGHLDAYFRARATHGLAIAWTPVPGESTLEPGFLYRVEGSDQNAIFGIAWHPVPDVTGRRIALKVVTDAETPPGGLLSISAPDGQLIEGDYGDLADSVVIGNQTLGSYREWICDEDGSWWMVRRSEVVDVGGVPTGAIVIKGTPVTIKGTYLVNTPPAPPPPALPVTIARPAVIVPRPTTAPIVRAPRAVETIELEDAFADASLEMDSAGEKFRVAETLQAVVVSTRFAFTLRTTSVYSTSYEEIGVMRIDGVALSGVATWVAELEVAVAGQVAELQLYDLTAAAVVATLTGTSTVTQKQSTLIAVPLAEHLYSVRLRRVGGGGTTDRVSCRSVYFEV